MGSGEETAGGSISDERVMATLQWWGEQKCRVFMEEEEKEDYLSLLPEEYELGGKCRVIYIIIFYNVYMYLIVKNELLRLSGI